MNPGHSGIRAVVLVCAATLVTTLVPEVSHAAWPHSPGINVPICTAAADQIIPAVVSDGAGGAIITWRDSRSDVADIYAQRVRASGAVDPAWPANGRALCTAASGQENPQLVSDGAGGAIVTWNDFRNVSDYDIYAQHVLASGAVDPAWPANGRLLCGAAGDQSTPTIVTDGAGGAIVTWMDRRSGTYDIYAGHVLATGAVDGAWPVNGRALCTAANHQSNPMIISDGSAGAIVTWFDLRSGAQDIYAQHVLASGVVDGVWPADGRALCTAGGDQVSPTIVPDGAGGAIVTWYDYRGGVATDIYAQHVLASGAVDGTWPVDGRAVCTATSYQSIPMIVSDGAGGAVITWQDLRSGVYDIYAQHVLATGAVDGAWPADGRALCTAGDHQQSPTIVGDGAGGAIVTWYDARSTTNYDIYAQHVFASGVVDPAWPADGRAVCTDAQTQYYPAIASDGSGGAIVVWPDHRTSADYDIYAQRVAPSGYLGNPEPGIVSVRDIPNDNGGKAKLSWTASYLDTDQPYFVDHYWIFRNAPPNFAANAVAEGARLLGPGDPEPLPGETAFFETVTSGTSYSWEFIASSPAAHFTSTYSYAAPTTSDSIGGSNPKTAFLVVGYNSGNTVYFLSNPDSGYSVDNLPPFNPGYFTGLYTGGATKLHWDQNHDPDLAGYRIYRGTSVNFVPGPANLIAAPADTGYSDVGPKGRYYKLSAVDVHGNESGFALLTPSTTLDAPVGGALRELAFGQAAPNPAETRASVHLALPRESRVILTIHDLAGREIQSLMAGTMPAGERDVTWNLRDAAGVRVADGIYFMRLEVEGQRIARRIAVVH